MLAGTITTANAQTVTQTQSKKRKQETHARHETNATRLARIAKTTEETYAHRYEVFGGGGYLRFRSGEYLRRNNEISWATAFNYYFTHKLAVVGDARGSFGNAHAYTGSGNPYGVYNPQINEYMFMGGVSYRFVMKEKFAVSAQALAGTSWGIFSGGSKGIPGADLGLWNDGLRPAFSLGVSGDYNVTPNLALRVTPTWMATDFVGPTGSTIQNNLGFNVGVVYRFGHQ